MVPSIDQGGAPRRTGDGGGTTGAEEQGNGSRLRYGNKHVGVMIGRSSTTSTGTRREVISVLEYCILLKFNHDKFSMNGHRIFDAENN